MIENERILRTVKNAMSGLLPVHIVENVAPKIAERLEAEGAIMPPCKAGDVVYVVYEGGEYYWRAEVLAIWTRQDKLETDTTITVKFKDETIDTLHSEVIYLTKEEAEHALRKEDERK